MITIPEVVEKIVVDSPLLEEGLSAGIINLSALARKIRPQVESKLVKTVQEGAIVMALKRLSIKIKEKLAKTVEISKNLGDLTVRSNLAEFTFLNSDSLVEKQKQLLHEIAEKKGAFLTFTQGVYESTIIVSSSIERRVKEIFREEKLLSKFTNLSSITIKLPQEAVYTPGIHYSILKWLAWENINVVEEVSTFTEFTIVLEETQVDRAFSLLNNVLR